jgi:micrococcal nuclease
LIRRAVLAALCAAVAVACPAGPREGEASTLRVLEVKDGDSLRVEVGPLALDARLAGLDAPELRQPGGREAMGALTALAEGRVFRFHEDGRDRYGRLIVTLHPLDFDGASAPGPSVNQMLIASGHAWHYRAYSKDPALAAAELVARTLRLGLWGAPDPTPPWEFRAERGARSPRPAPSEPVEIDDTTAIIGNVRSQIYHLRGCPGFLRVAPHNRALFATEDEARAAGYRRAGNCE